MNSELCVRWSEHAISFARSLSSLHASSHLADVTVSCGQQHFAAHKLVLATCSDYFDDLFRTNNQMCLPGMTPVVVLRDADPEHFSLLLKFMYCGAITVYEDELVHVISLAKHLGIRGLAPSSDIAPQMTTDPSTNAFLGSEPAANYGDTMDDSFFGDTKTAMDESTNVEMDHEEHVESHGKQREKEGEELDKSDLYDEEDVPDNLGQELDFETISGRLPSSWLYLCDGNIFVKAGDTKGKNIRHLKCRHTNPRCRGTAVLKFNTNKIVKKQHHTCSDNHMSVAILKAKVEMKHLATTTTRSKRSIYDSVIAKMPEMAEHLDFPSIRCTMEKWRKGVVHQLIKAE